MDALSKARELTEHAYYDEHGMADVMRQDAAIYAAIAQADAARPLFIRIDRRVFNVAHITDVDLDYKDYDGGSIVRILLSSSGAEGAREIWWRGSQYQPAADFLRQVLQPLLVAEIDLPPK